MAIRDQAKADAERAQAMLQHSGSQAVTPQMLSKFARAARQLSVLKVVAIAAIIFARSPRSQGPPHGIEVPAARGARSERRRKRSAHSETEMAEASGNICVAVSRACRSNSWSGNDHNGTGRETDQFLRDASEQQPGKPTTAPPANYDDVDIFPLRRLDNGCGRIAPSGLNMNLR